jgi:hypothetical protein
MNKLSGPVGIWARIDLPPSKIALNPEPIGSSRNPGQWHTLSGHE